MTADLFCLVFKPVEADVALPEDAQSGENRKVHEVAVSQREEAERVERLAKRFAVKVPELKFSPAEIFSFLLEHRKSPEEAIDNVEQLISKPIGAKSKPPRISEDAKPEDTQLVCIQRSVNKTLLTIYLDGVRNLQRRKSQPRWFKPPCPLHHRAAQIYHSPSALIRRATPKSWSKPSWIWR
jgi:hypothetical protein